jgi:hypothetical protein
VLKTANGDCMELTDLPSEFLYRTLDTVRERLMLTTRANRMGSIGPSRSFHFQLR